MAINKLIYKLEAKIHCTHASGALLWVLPLQVMCDCQCTVH